MRQRKFNPLQLQSRKAETDHLMLGQQLRDRREPTHSLSNNDAAQIRYRIHQRKRNSKVIFETKRIIKSVAAVAVLLLLTVGAITWWQSNGRPQEPNATTPIAALDGNAEQSTPTSQPTSTPQQPTAIETKPPSPATIEPTEVAPPQDNGIYIRIHNASNLHFDEVQITFANGRQENFTNLEAGNTTDYHQIESGDQFPQFEAQADGEKYIWQPVNLAGTIPLTTGQFTYIINIDGPVRSQLIVNDTTPTVHQIHSFSAELTETAVDSRQITFEWETSGGVSAQMRTKFDVGPNVTMDVPVNNGTTMTVTDNDHQIGTVLLTLLDSQNRRTYAALNIHLPCTYTYFFPIDEQLCAESAVQTTTITEQPFEGGIIFWLAASNEIYVLFNEIVTTHLFSPPLAVFANPESAAESAPIQPPDGFVEPETNLSQIWQTVPLVKDSLGWATSEGVTYEATWQMGNTLPDGSIVLYIQLANGEIVRLARNDDYDYDDPIIDGTWERVEIE